MTESSSTILVVDSTAGQRAFVAASLENGGYHVITAGGGMEAMARLCYGRNVDLIVTELDLPDLDGYHLIRAVRSEPDWQTLPIVVVTSSDTDGEPSNLSAEGATAVICKPLTAKVLLAEVERQLARVEATRRPSSHPRTKHR